MSRDAIVTWIKKKIGPGVQNITTIEEAEKILTSDSKVVLGFLDSLVLIFSFEFFFYQLLLFAISNDTKKVMPAFQEAAKLFKGKVDLTSDIFYFHLKLIFVYVEMDNEDVGKPVSDYFGVTGDGPQVSISPIFNPKFGLQLIIDISVLSTILHLYDLDRFWHTREMKMPRNFFLMVKSHLIMLRLVSLDPCLT
ncbi:hypothetical protein BHE74_00031372 [Ensete ventricosum]|nr:hypothetical protein GW17_00042373 [Ensete ventricosum]RWW61567.1 hypothetical protein BHE74_00031372 [Ensete ventricosum]RZR84754.1 hypothetical protein BHM03_00011624 [Ensete ventricosum]